MTICFPDPERWGVGRDAHPSWKPKGKVEGDGDMRTAGRITYLRGCHCSPGDFKRFQISRILIKVSKEKSGIVTSQVLQLK